MSYDGNLQLGIAEFLHGGSAFTALAISNDQTYFDRRIPLLEMEIQDNAVKEMCSAVLNNGMPRRCLSCFSFRSEIKTYKNPSTDTNHIQQNFKCERYGCNEARLEFVDAHKEMEKNGQSFIDLNVSIALERDDLLTPTTIASRMVVPRPPIERCVRLSAKLKSVSKKTHGITEAQELQEIETLFDLGLISINGSRSANTPANYGEEVW